MAEERSWDGGTYPSLVDQFHKLTLASVDMSAEMREAIQEGFHFYMEVLQSLDHTMSLDVVLNLIDNGSFATLVDFLLYADIPSEGLEDGSDIGWKINNLIGYDSDGELYEPFSPTLPRFKSSFSDLELEIGKIVPQLTRANGYRCDLLKTTLPEKDDWQRFVDQYGDKNHLEFQLSANLDRDESFSGLEWNVSVHCFSTKEGLNAGRTFCWYPVWDAPLNVEHLRWVLRRLMLIAMARILFSK